MAATGGLSALRGITRLATASGARRIGSTGAKRRATNMRVRSAGGAVPTEAGAAAAAAGPLGRRFAAAMLGVSCVAMRGGRAYASSAPSQPFSELQYEDVKEGTGEEVSGGRGGIPLSEFADDGDVARD